MGRTDTHGAEMLKGLPADRREKLRRICMVSSADDLDIATQVNCGPVHVRAMRQRLMALGVLPRPEIEHAPRKARPAKPSKYRNGDLFEDGQ